MGGCCQSESAAATCFLGDPEDVCKYGQEAVRERCPGAEGLDEPVCQSQAWQHDHRGCCIFKLEVLREHKPPPNMAIRRIRISDFGLPDLKRDPDRHQNCITWSLSHALPLQKISSKSVHKFASNPTDRQTNRPNQKHNLLLRQR